MSRAGAVMAWGRARALAWLLPALLCGCSGNEQMIALQDYVQSVVNRPPGRIEPLPEFVSYEAFSYSAAGLRSPFDAPVDASLARRNQGNSNVKPDENRVKEPLEAFALASLKMVGTVARDGRTWALVRDDTNRVTRVAVGNYLGRNYGRIVGISETQVDMVEIVPSGDGGWLERPQSLMLGAGAGTTGAGAAAGTDAGTAAAGAATPE